ncbi:hypothetical protein Dsin_019530 [Dipteronia sinensis]|uniref:Uncharacterized protein n=1 Tax=Dipteronia sinensis TaxID=43782 RepID=A0AAE0E434_9ROSI|nr:hypothetical protein Dsin_019530 [Dipteronia sinensis]
MMMMNGFSTNYYGGLTESLVFSQIPDPNRSKITATTTDPQFSICVGSLISTWGNNYKAKNSKDSEARRGTSGSSPADQSDNDPDLEGSENIHNILLENKQHDSPFSTHTPHLYNSYSLTA